MCQWVSSLDPYIIADYALPHDEQMATKRLHLAIPPLPILRPPDIGPSCFLSAWVKNSPRLTSHVRFLCNPYWYAGRQSRHGNPNRDRARSDRKGHALPILRLLTKLRQWGNPNCGARYLLLYALGEYERDAATTGFMRICSVIRRDPIARQSTAGGQDAQGYRATSR
jgi:hypothetical protein